MVTRVQKWGNSQGIRLSRQSLAEAGLEVGDAVDVSVRDGAIVVTPARRVRGAHDLGELVARISRGYVVSEFEWGPAAGKEVW